MEDQETDQLAKKMSSEKELLKGIPRSPGVYIMKGKGGRVLYVGKARLLFSRVRSYFHKSSSHSVRIARMVSQVEDIDCMITGNEVEALILECNLIKHHKPPFNVILRDDKHYPYIKLTKEKFPRLLVVRRVIKDGGTYFGPFPAVNAMRNTIKFIQHVFKVRQSADPLDPEKKKRRPCLNYQIGLCLAPCAGYISETRYQGIIREIQLFLKGKNTELIRYLTESMNSASKSERFEEAARFRDQIFAIQKLQEKQSAISVGMEDRDVVVLKRAGRMAAVHVLFCRAGKIIGDKSVILGDGPDNEYDDAEIIQAFISQYYSSDVYFPDELVVNSNIQTECIEKWLTGLRGKRVSVIFPKRGVRASLVSMAMENAGSVLQKRADSKKIAEEAIADLKKSLGLGNMPNIIEAYDISNITGGEAAVGTKVVFIDGQKERSKYRKYKIRSLSKADDVGMMREVLSRRFSRAIEKEDGLPDLLLLDGGKGQLNAVKTLMSDLEISGPDLIGLAKGRDRHNPETDQVYLAGLKTPVSLPENSPAMRLLQRVRDESHRFSIEYHRLLRNREGFLSPLDGIPGIGPVRKKKLLLRFGSVKGIREASCKKLMEVLGGNRRAAQTVLEHLGSSD